MFDIGFLELVLLGIVALLVLGPERLPHAARMTGAFLGKINRMVQSVRVEMEREVNLYEMQERIKKQVEEGMIGDIKKELTETGKAFKDGIQSVQQEASTSPSPSTPQITPPTTASSEKPSPEKLSAEKPSHEPPQQTEAVKPQL
ncbi:Sec-independent protein translocase protein [gamma proteobacterium HdN1]|nr:Sec-independent protein translocase protein [gamma proteobacterium HdN1]